MTSPFVRSDEDTDDDSQTFQATPTTTRSNSIAGSTAPISFPLRGGAIPSSYVIPSIEPPDEVSNQFSDLQIEASTAGSTPASPFDNRGTISPINDGLSAFHFGSDRRQSTPFTFRGMYNTTPEPASRQHGNSIRNDRSRENNSEIVSRPGSRDSHSIENSQSTDSMHAAQPNMSPPVVAAEVLSDPPVGYRTIDENAPKQPYFTKSFQTAIKKGIKIAEELETILGQCDLAKEKDSQIYEMLQTAKELRGFEAPPVCTIGIVGDSGTGKSSLINSLLDQEDLAMTAGMGEACTSVVTEYRLRQQQHRSAYTIEVDCMTEKEIDEELRELLWSYRQFHFYDLNSMSMTADEYAKLEKQSQTAWDTLQAVFPSKPELTQDFLEAKDDGAEGRITDLLRRWIREIDWPNDMRSMGLVREASSAELCSAEMEELISGNIWPFIKVVRVYLSAQVLKSGVILADLPGFHDSNQARIKAAEIYMYNCDEIFVVADINRVATNKSVNSLLNGPLSKSLNGRPQQGFALICTKSEDFKRREVKKKFAGQHKVLDLARIKRLENIIKQAAMDKRKADAWQRSEDADDELNNIFMTARNNYIKDIVLKTYENPSTERPMSVFCISNKLYEECRERARDHGLPIQGSGIPALRQHCHTIPGWAQLRIANHFLGIKLKDLVQRVNLWLSGGSQATLPNDKTVQQLLNVLEDNVQKIVWEQLVESKTQMRTSVQEIMIDPIEAKLPDWTVAAVSALELDFGKCAHNQIAAFCRRNGTWGSPNINHMEWNLDIIRAMVVDTKNWWKDLATSLDTIFDLYHSQIQSVLQDLITRVKDFHAAPLFAETLRTKIEEIDYIFEKVKEMNNKAYESIQRDASQNHTSSYIHEAMCPVYRACASDSDVGVTIRRKNRLLAAIGTPQQPVLFMTIRSRQREALTDAVSRTTIVLRGNLSSILAQIGKDIEMLRGSEAQVLAKNGDFLERLGIVVQSVLTGMEEIQELVTQAKESG